MKRRLFSIVIALCCTFCLWATLAWAADEPANSRAYGIDEIFVQDLGPNDCPSLPDGRHYWDGKITIIPSLTAEGEYTYACKGCGKIIKLRMQPAVSEYQIAAWRRSNPQALSADEVSPIDKPEQTEQTAAVEPKAELLHNGSGCQAINKLSPGQINQLLTAAPNYDFTPDEIGTKKTAWQAVLTRLNALRRIASLPEVHLDDSYAAQFETGPDAMLAESTAGAISSVMHRRWLLNPALGQDEPTGNVYDYDYIAWPASGNFPNNIFTADTPWSISLNPDKFQTPNIYEVHVNITRPMDNTKWHFGGVNGDNYKAADSGKYYNVDILETAQDNLNNCIIFRPDNIIKYQGSYDIPEYQGSYNVQISGLHYLDGRPVTIAYSVEFFTPGANDTLDKPNDKPAELPTENEPAAINSPFKDVQSSDYFARPVVWAVEKGITKGASEDSFEPNATCTKAQIITLLWRAYGSPQSAIPNPFRDVQKSDYYYDATLWAAENGILAGNRFNGETPCTRAMTVNYLWLAAGSPNPALTAQFADVPANTPYNLAVAWAVEQNITNGATPTTFEPQQTCTRSDIVTFLYRNLAEQ